MLPAAFGLGLMLSASLSFAAKNQGQLPPRVIENGLPIVFEPVGVGGPNGAAMLGRAAGLTMGFRPRVVDVGFQGKKTSQLEIEFKGASSTVPAGTNLLKSQTNYLLGADPAHWRTHVPNYSKVTYAGLYPGIDAIFYGNGQQMEHDFVVSPGGDYRQIRMHLSSNASASVGKDGALLIALPDGSLQMQKPLVYQEENGKRQQRSGKIILLSDREIGFSIAEYDSRQTLVIDPVLSFATYLDGSTGMDWIHALAADAAGNIYVTGSTSSSDFPSVKPEQPANMGYGDAFIAKLDPTGHTLIYSTFLGGTNTDEAESIAVDGNGNVVVSGTSESRDFPQAGKLSSANPNYTNTYNFIASLDATGASLRYSGFLGETLGDHDDSTPRLNRVAFDPQGNAYIAGKTDDPSFTITPGAYGRAVAPYPADDTLFIAKIQSDGAFAYAATIPEVPVQHQLGSNAGGIDIGNIAVDLTGAVILGGTAGSDLPTTSGTLEPTLPSGSNGGGFALKLNPAGSDLIFSTYLPGGGVSDLAISSLGNVYLAGATNDSTLPTSANAFQKTQVPRGLDSTVAGYVLELSGDGTAVVSATYFGGTTAQGTGSTAIQSISLDAHGNVDIAGSTGAADLPLKNPLVSILNQTGLGSVDSALFAAQLSADLSTQQFGTFLSANDGGSALGGFAVDASSHFLLGGSSYSKNFPTTAGSFQPSPPTGSYSGDRWNFIAKIDLSVPAPSMCFDTTSVNFGPVLVYTVGNATVNITNCGNAPLTLASVTSSDPTVTATQNCTGIPAAGVCQLQLAYAPTAPGNVFGNLNLSSNSATSPQLVSFIGTAGSPQVYVPSTIAFDPLLVGETGSGGIAFLSNYQGNGAFILSQAAITGDFQIVQNTCTAPVPVGGYCYIYINFSPTAAGTRTGVLTLTDNLTPTVQTISLFGTGLTSAPAPTITVIPAIYMGTPVSQALSVFGTGFMPNSTILWNGSPRTTYYDGETLLVADLLPADLQQVGEAQVTVTTPAPGGGTTAPYTATIYGMLQNVSVVREVFETHSQLIYATVSKTSSTYANSVVAIDPVKMQVVKTLLTGNGPNAIAVSDDGSMLYIGLDDILSVTQVSLPGGTRNFTLTLPSVSLNNGIDVYPDIIASGLHVVPGQPHTWLVGLCESSVEPCGLGVAVFDDAKMRPTEALEDQLTASSFVFVNDPTVAYSTEFDREPPDMSAYKITASGITRTAVSPFLPGVGGSVLLSDGTSIYDSIGQVIDPATLAVQSTYPQANPYAALGTSGFTVDELNQRLYFVGPPTSTFIDNASVSLLAVGKTAMNTIGEIDFQAPTNFISSIERFGTNGIAINQGSDWLFVKTSLAQSIAPGIIALSPNYGAIAASVNISGASFGATEGDGYVQVNGAKSQIISWSNSAITVRVPYNGAPGRGSVTVTANGQKSNAVPFTLYAFPAITNVSVSSGTPGTPVTITGTNLLDGGSNASVTFNGTPATVTRDSATSIQVSVPTGATSGQLRITVNGVSLEAVANFLVEPSLPNITSISSHYGAIAASINLTGNFGATEGGGYVQVNGAKSQVTAWSGTAITVRVPYNGAPGLGAVTVTADGIRSNALPFTLYPFPAITGVSVSTGTPGTPVTITGSNLLDGGGKASVAFNGTPATITSDTAASIGVSVPTGATSGQLRITVNGVSLEAPNFVVEPSLPNITGISSSYGAIAASINLTGNFGATQGAGYVQVNGAKSQVVAWSNSAITVRVPYNGSPGLGSIAVTADGIKSNTVPFTLYAFPAITGVSVSSGAAGTPVTITGTNLLDGGAKASVTFNGIPAAITSDTATSIQVSVPAAATSGQLRVTVNGVSLEAAANFAVN